jgi:hypothetical protein
MRTTARSNQRDDSLVFIICAVVVALIALYVTRDIEAFEWIVFTFYAVFIFAGEFLMSRFVFKGNNMLSTFASITTGSFVGILFVMKAILTYW